jgi:hypothetical protein
VTVGSLESGPLVGVVAPVGPVLEEPALRSALSAGFWLPTVIVLVLPELPQPAIAIATATVVRARPDWPRTPCVPLK